MTIDVSPSGLARLRAFEGLRLAPYLDVAGIRTVGYGHARWSGGDIDQAQADALLVADVRPCVGCIALNVTVELTQGQIDALVSFVFNVGVGAFLGSTMLRLLNAGDYEGAADQFPEWCHAMVNGEKTVIPALLARRQAERAMFLG